MKNGSHPSAFAVLDVLTDLLNGGRHSRTTVARGFRVSLPTADRWLQELARVPGIVRTKIGKTAWVEWRAPKHVLPRSP